MVVGYAWAPQITGLVRGEPKPGQKHRSNGLAIIKELAEERASDSPTLDRDRSVNNTYWHRDGGKSGTATWEAMCAEAEAYRIPVKLKNGKMAERGLRGDAVIGWAAILKPPPEMVAELGMDDAEQVRFCEDCFKALEKIEPRVFRQENVTVDAYHRDEGTPPLFVTHGHKVGTSKDKNGRYCGNLIDANLCVRINEQFPALMRAMHWPIDDLDVTDWDRMGYVQDDEGHTLYDIHGKPCLIDPEYVKERNDKWKRQGQSVDKYAEQKAKAATETAARIIADAKEQAAEVKAKAVKDAKEDAARIVRDAEHEAMRTRKTALSKSIEYQETAEAAVDGHVAKAQGAVDLLKIELAQVTKEIAAKVEELGDMADYPEFRRRRAAERAQDAQDAARREQEEREARAVKEAAREPQGAVQATPAATLEQDAADMVQESQAVSKEGSARRALAFLAKRQAATPSGPSLWNGPEV